MSEAQARSGAASPLHDPARVAALRAVGLIDQPPDPALDRFTQLAARLIGAPVSLLSLVDTDRQYFASQFGLQEPWASRRQTPLSHSFCQHVVLDGDVLVVGDARANPELADNLAIRDIGMIAYAGVPLRGPNGDVLGAFCVMDDAPRAWTEQDLEVLRDFAEAVTAELRLRELAGRASAILASLPVVTFDLEPLTARLLALDGEVERLFGVDRRALLRDEARWAGAVDRNDRALVADARARAASGEVVTIAYRLRPRSGPPLWVQETVRPRFGGNGEPVAVHGAIVDISPQHQIGQRLDAQNRVASALASATSVEGAARGVLAELGRSLDWEVGAVWLPDEGTGLLRPIAQWAADHYTDSTFIARTATMRLAPGQGLPGACWAEATTMWIDDVTVEENFVRRDAALLDDLHSAIAFPLLRGDEAAGIVEFFTREMRAPDQGLVDVTRAIGRQIGQFLDRMDSERELRASREYYRRVARTFQRSLVPTQPPEIEGVDVAVRFHPATAGNLVGGDFFDVFRLGDGRWAISIGDVCGKGTAAAAVTSLVRHSLRGAALTVTSPAAALEIANQALLSEDLDERFCSAMLAEVQCMPGSTTTEVTLANAGHPKALVVRSDGSIERAGPPALVLGVTAPIGATAERVSLQPGDALVLYTDGYTEARSAGVEFGEERLEEMLRSCAGRDAETIARGVDDGVERFANDAGRDDQALVVIRAADPVRAASGEIVVPLPSDATAPRAARDAVHQALEAWELGDLTETAALLASELTTNALLHAGGIGELRIRRSKGGARVEVRDPSRAVPHARGYSQEALTGRGLALVHALASEAGVELTEDGKSIWFEVSATDPPDGGTRFQEGEGLLAPGLAVRLLSVPVVVYRASQEQIDALLRETALDAWSQGNSAATGAIADAAQAHTLIAERVGAAVEQAELEGQTTIDVEIELPAHVADGAIELLAVLEAAEQRAARRELLTSQTLPELLALRRWYLTQVVDQLRGSAPRRWDGASHDVLNVVRAGSGVDWHALGIDPNEASAMVADEGNRIVGATEAAATLLGTSPSSLAGARVVSIIPERFRERHVAAFTRYLITSHGTLGDRTIEVPALRADGTEVDILLRLEGRRTPEGRRLFIAWMTPAPAASD